MVIECYFDDSGQEAQADHRHVCMAGYLAHDSYWYRFNNMWHHLLLQRGIPAVHMKEWLNTAREKGWTSEEQKEALSDFITTIKQCRLIGFGVAVDADVWRKLPHSRRKNFGNAQDFCFQRIMRRVVDRFAGAKDHDMVSVVFDQDFGHARRRLGLLDHLRKVDSRITNIIGSISFSNSQFYYPLQAADILAWQTRRHLENQALSRRPMHGWEQLFTEHPNYRLDYEGEFWDQSMVDTNFTAVEQEIQNSIIVNDAKE